MISYVYVIDFAWFCHIISYHIISYHIISYHIISYHIICVLFILSYPFISSLPCRKPRPAEAQRGHLWKQPVHAAHGGHDALNVRLPWKKAHLQGVVFCRGFILFIYIYMTSIELNMGFIDICFQLTINILIFVCCMISLIN